ncbi:DUF4476 domain-containing protein [Aureivirga marina]|uniref:DUF4476 domain-containing protein n=1 Tax=Aureivirga marina TaxID=1182451 RepID=UPI0018CAD24C|nr:DUF4476 domain-containing protein [Aureivirga marina]
MKNYLIFTLLCLFSFTTFAQNDYELTIFNKREKKFTLFINGIKQNDHPTDEVTIPGLTDRKYNLMIIFKNKNLKSFQEEITMPDESGEIAYKIKRKKKGDFYLKLYAQIPREYKDFIHVEDNEEVVDSEGPDNEVEVVVVKEDECKPMTSSDFDSAKKSIKSKAFSETKIRVAKQIIDYNCFTVSQVGELMKIFSFDDSKLDIAKYAFDKTTDKGNYYKLNDLFSFDSSIEKLQKFIKNQEK